MDRVAGPDHTGRLLVEEDREGRRPLPDLGGMGRIVRGRWRGTSGARHGRVQRDRRERDARRRPDAPGGPPSSPAIAAPPGTPAWRAGTSARDVDHLVVDDGPTRAGRRALKVTRRMALPSPQTTALARRQIDVGQRPPATSRASAAGRPTSRSTAAASSASASGPSAPPSLARITPKTAPADDVVQQPRRRSPGSAAPRHLAAGRPPGDARAPRPSAPGRGWCGRRTTPRSGRDRPSARSAGRRPTGSPPDRRAAAFSRSSAWPSSSVASAVAAARIASLESK